MRLWANSSRDSISFFFVHVSHTHTQHCTCTLGYCSSACLVLLDSLHTALAETPHSQRLVGPVISSTSENICY